MMKAITITLVLIGINVVSSLEIESIRGYPHPRFPNPGPPRQPRPVSGVGSVNTRLDATDDDNQEEDLETINANCICMPYSKCNYDGKVNADGLGLIDIRIGNGDSNDAPTAKRKQCATNETHYLDVCCIIPAQDNANLEDQILDIFADPKDNSTTQPEQSTSEESQPPTGINGASHLDRGCGVRNTNGVGFRIIGNEGNEANFGEYPWMVAVFKDKAYKCGGSLIQSGVILTAAHCVDGSKAESLIVRAGEWDTRTRNEPLPHQDRQVSAVLIHPNYRKGILHNDYALLILDSPVTLADNVETVCLPDPNQEVEVNNCQATGWGKDKFDDTASYQEILKTVTLPIVAHADCQRKLQATERLGRYFKLHESFTCAGGAENVDTCSGDGGSPLVCAIKKDPLRYVQVGIVSWGIGCGANDVPGVYADVAKARSWIDRTLSRYNIDTTSYTSPDNDGAPRFGNQ